jgi:putative FmdB family regulatory protein
MPIYEYACALCGHRADILHGVHEPGPNFCPECGSEGSMRKAFAPPTIVFKGSGWAKKERRSAAWDARSTSSSSDDGKSSGASAGSDSGGKEGAAPKDTSGAASTSGSGSSDPD